MSIEVKDFVKNQYILNKQFLLQNFGQLAFCYVVSKIFQEILGDGELMYVTGDIENNKGKLIRERLGLSILPLPEEKISPELQEALKGTRVSHIAYHVILKLSNNDVIDATMEQFSRVEYNQYFEPVFYGNLDDYRKLYHTFQISDKPPPVFYDSNSKVYRDIQPTSVGNYTYPVIMFINQMREKYFSPQIKRTPISRKELRELRRKARELNIFLGK